MFIDTHTHIYGEEYDADREQVISRAVEAGAQKLLLPNIDEASIGPMTALCAAHPGLCHPMMGLHPTELPEHPHQLLDRMERLLEAEGHPYVAIGEVGIDLYWDDTRREEQTDTFRRQAEWAVKYRLPLMIHTRKAHRELVDTLRPLSGDLSGVFHCFSGSREEAAELLRLFPGFCLGIGGVVTFKNAKLPATLRDAVPLSRIVTETDAPYLTPTPHRGERNEPAYIPLITRKIAEVYDRPTEDVERQLIENALRIFPRIKGGAQAG